MCPQIQPDFSQAVEALSPGEYAARIVGSEIKASGEKSKNPGTPMVKWELETFGKDDEKLNGRKIIYTTMAAGPGSGLLKAFVKAVTGSEPAPAFDTDELHGREVVVVLKEDKNNPAFPAVATVKPYKN